MVSGDHEAPPRIPPSVIGAPRIRQMYWCRLPTDAELPELWKTRPVIIISFKNTLSGAVTVIPTTTVEQDGNPWAVRLRTPFDPSKVSWAICDKPMTVAVSRLQASRKIIRLGEDEFNEVVKLLLKWLPVLPGP